MSEKDNNGAQELNLGLSEILGDQHGTSNSPSEKLPGEKKETEIFTLDEGAGDLRHELLALANQKQWGLLVSKAEAAIAANDDVEARLWWLRGHLGAFSLPVSLLAAPFETICRQIRGGECQSRHLTLIREIGTMMLERLRDVGDKRQEEGVRLALCDLGIGDVPEAKSGLRGQIPPLTPNFDKGSNKSDDAAPVALQLEPSQIRVVKRVSWALLLALLFFVVIYGAWRWAYQEVEVGLAPEPFMANGEMPELRPPTPLAIEALGNLGALFYSITEGSKAQNTKGSGPSPIQAQTPQRADPTVGSPENKREPVMGSLDQKPATSTTPTTSGTVDTSGPVEGPEFRKGVESNPPDRARLPDTVGEARSGDGSTGDASYADGALRLPEVLKTIIVRTDVMANPSYQARVIGTLERGDRVSVEGRVGQWLRIRSRKGRAGFVFAQDVGDIEDFRAGR